MVYFSDIFNVDESILESYGAMNISLLNDIPLFIDPFLLYASEKPEYRQLHENILDYLSFLRDKASGFISSEKIKRWYTFPEVKQNWLGYSESGNGGLGLGKDFGQSMSKAIQGVFPDLKNEKITETSHLEKLSLFKVGVGRDNISDFTCNLIKKYLLEYTQTFAMQYLSLEQCKNIAVSKVYFDYKYENWMSQKYILPYFNPRKWQHLSSIWYLFLCHLCHDRIKKKSPIWGQNLVGLFLRYRTLYYFNEILFAVSRFFELTKSA